MRTIIKYQAFDGTIFDSEIECQKYEEKNCKNIVALNARLDRVPISDIDDQGYYILVKDKQGITLANEYSFDFIDKVGTYAYIADKWVYLDDVLVKLIEA